MSSKIKTKRERVKFASDNVAGACSEVLDTIIKANEGELDGKAVRLVASWNTKESDVDQLLETISKKN